MKYGSKWMAKNFRNMECTTPRQIKQRSLAGSLQKLERCVIPRVYPCKFYYIPVLQAFKICYKNSHRTFATGAHVLVDGNSCPGRILHPRQARPFQPDTIELNGVPVSNNSYRPFVFSNCQLTGRSAAAIEESSRNH